MAYFLKITKPNGGERQYLQIYESFYSAEKKGTAHRSYKALGYVDKLKQSGISDPISYYKDEVAKMNASRKAQGPQFIGKSPIRYLGYFPLRSILNKLEVKKYVNIFNLTRDFSFELYDILSALVYARCVNPCSKYRTFHEVIPYLFEEHDFSYDQLLDGLAFLGNNYEKFVELFTARTKTVFGIDADKTYFDCTNFYFEIDHEDELRRKGPSKENRKDPIIGLGLLLDKNLLPIGMRMYPGNESEKPVLRTVIQTLKAQNNITGKTIQVADKGLNCAENIFAAKKDGDGYLFSKSCKTLPKLEKEWVFLDGKDWKDKLDANGKLIYRYKSCIDEFPYTYTDQKTNTKTTVRIKEKRLLTYNPTLAKKQKLEIEKMVNHIKALTLSGAKKNAFGDSGKYISVESVNKNGIVGEDDTVVLVNEKKVNEDIALAGYNLLVTSETMMSDAEIYDTYHRLWRIEESFRIMKSDLDSRPVFVQKEETIKGHFLVCYLSVLLIRLFQFKVLENKYCSSDLIHFLRDFKVTSVDGKYINLTEDTGFIRDFADFTRLPLRNCVLTETQLNSILKYSLKDL